VLTERRKVKSLKKAQDLADQPINSERASICQQQLIHNKPTTPKGKSHSKEVIHSEPRTPQVKTPKTAIIHQIQL